MKKSIIIALLTFIIACKPATTEKNPTSTNVFEMEFNVKTSLKDQFKATIMSKNTSDNSLTKTYSNLIFGESNQKFILDQNYFPTRVVLNLGGLDKEIKVNNFSLQFGDKMLKMDDTKKLTDFFALNKFVKYDVDSKTLIISKEDKKIAKPLLILKKKVLDSLR